MPPRALTGWCPGQAKLPDVPKPAVAVPVAGAMEKPGLLEATLGKSLWNRQCGIPIPSGRFGME